ncbi:DNA polymerase II [uncultured Shewanella sp.]|uniref:DNA polymerase II n=1 Tax=uncultured Shewanella sp. TaxID=173975 RepID=UPI002616417A|nr:DNA polymerase II [uncultured Shewanella sp.]
MNKEVLPAGVLKGRVLSREISQDSGSLCLHYYLKTDNGPVLVRVPQAEFICFCSTVNLQQLLSIPAIGVVRTKSLSLQNFDSENVTAIYCQSRQGFRHLTKGAIDLGISLFEAEIRPESRYLIERFIALDAEFMGEFSSSSSRLNLPVFTATRARRCSVEIKLTSISLDFECSFDGELYSVGLYGRNEAGENYEKVIMVGREDDVAFYVRQGEQSGAAGYIEWVRDEKALIHALIEWFARYDPDLIIGWAVVTFDLALLYRRAKQHGIALTIGRGGGVLGWKVEGKFRPETLYLPGRVVLDGIDWLKAAFYRFDSFSLESVSRALLGRGKAIDSVENRAGEITELFHNDKLALAQYNLNDCRLVWDIFEKTQLFAFATERSRLTGLELGRVGGSVAAFNNLYLPHLHRAGYVAPAMAVGQGLESPGGYVMDSIPGLYRDILVLDFKSLYPSIIRTFLIDPKGLIEGLSLPDSETVDGFIGAKFSRQAPILPQLIKTLAEHREEAKAENNAPLSQAIKIIMNSLYGVLGSKGCVFHDARLASSITLRGHQIMKQTKVWIEELGYQVIYGDTDSTFVWLGDKPAETDPVKLGNQLVEMVNNKWVEKLKKEMQLDCYLELEFESHFEQFFMPTLRGRSEGSKKRYVGAYRKDDGELEIVFKGMEQVRSDWSPLARRIQQELYFRVFSKLDVVGFLRNVIDELMTGKLDDELVFSKRLRRDIKDYTAKSSPHVKAAQKMCELSKDTRYSKRGTRVDYLMTINGAEPVKFRRSAIDYEYYLNRQLLPISDPILTVLKLNFGNIASNQLSLI